MKQLGLEPEQLGFEKVFGQGRAIHLKEGVARARRREVERVGDDLLADAGLAEQQDGDVVARDVRDDVADRLHRPASPPLLCR